MNATKLPSLLELMIDKASIEGTPDPLYECKMGWCTQCACNKDEVKISFGEIHYRTEPIMPPVPGKILPCISTQTKFSATLEDVKSLFNEPNVHVIKLSTVHARTPSAEEVGKTLKSLVLMNGKVVVGSRTELSEASVIVRNPKPIASGKYTDMVIDADKFLKSYDRLPGSDFEVFSVSKPVNGFCITESVIESWPKDDDGKTYYKSGRDIYQVGVGSIITVNGNALTDELMSRVNIVDVSAKVDVKSTKAYEMSLY
jgi:hypothetical protein